MAACPVSDISTAFANWSAALASIASRYSVASQASAGMPKRGSKRKSRRPGRARHGAGRRLRRPDDAIESSDLDGESHAGASSSRNIGTTIASVVATCHP